MLLMLKIYFCTT